MHPQREIRRLQKIDERLYQIGKKISFFAINPSNGVREMQKFMKNSGYNPQFRYERYRNNLDKLLEKLQAIKIGDSVMEKQIFEKKKREFFLMLNMLKARGKEEFTHLAVQQYGTPSKDLLGKARKLLKIQPERSVAKLTTAELMQILQQMFHAFGFNWELKERSMSAFAAVNQSKRQLRLKKDERFSPAVLQRIIVHEIGVHVLRTENGALQPYKVFANGLPKYLETEEGLAVMNEEMAKVLDKETLKTYAGRAIAADMALRESFKDIYNFLLDYFDEEEAWKITVRAKRGMGDTSLAGGCTKDYLYLNGYFKIKNYIKRGGNITKLYYGKVGLPQVKILDKIPGLVEPKYLPGVWKQ